MTHTRHAFDEQLQDLNRRLLLFGSFVEAMLDKAMRALITQDATLAREVVASDDVADDMDLEIEQMCVRLLALQQPMAGDLRFIASVMKVIADIERIGDYSKDIAKAAISLANDEYFKPLVDIPLMGDRVRHMLRLALQALVTHNLDIVEEVLSLDSGVDVLWKQVRKDVEKIIQERPEVVHQAISLIMVARYLERIGDHIENIGERVRYTETGK
ncbi:MAG: phosphate signaling complex protein PhoU [Armatimonadota bacterium]